MHCLCTACTLLDDANRDAPARCAPPTHSPYYSLLATHHSLLTTYDLLLTTYHSLLTTHCCQVRSFNPFAFTRLFFMSKAMRWLAVLSALTLAPIFMGDTLQVLVLHVHVGGCMCMCTATAGSLP